MLKLHKCGYRHGRFLWRTERISDIGAVHIPRCTQSEFLSTEDLISDQDKPVNGETTMLSTPTCFKHQLFFSSHQTQLPLPSISPAIWTLPLKQRCALAAGKQSTSCSGQPKKVSALNEVHISTFSLYDNLELSLWCWSDCRSRRWQELIEKESWEENPLLLLQNKFKTVLRMMNNCHCNHVTMLLLLIKHWC